jgi:hypothetical protein
MKLENVALSCVLLAIAYTLAPGATLASNIGLATVLYLALQAGIRLLSRVTVGLANQRPDPVVRHLLEGPRQHR